MVLLMLTLKEMLGSPSAGKPKHHDSEKEELSIPFSANPLPGENSSVIRYGTRFQATLKLSRTHLITWVYKTLDKGQIKPLRIPRGTFLLREVKPNINEPTSYISKGTCYMGIYAKKRLKCGYYLFVIPSSWLQPSSSSPPPPISVRGQSSTPSHTCVR